MASGHYPLDLAQDLDSRLEDVILKASGTAPATDGRWVLYVQHGGPVREDRPGRIVIRSTDGLPSIPYLDGGLGSRERQARVQIQIVGSRNDPQRAAVIAERLRGQLDRSPPSGYFRQRVTNMSNVGVDDGHPDWRINVEAWREEKPRPHYWGAAAAGAGDEAFIKALASEQDAVSRFRMMVMTVPGGQQGWYALPADEGTPVFTTNGVAGGWSLVGGAIALSHGFGSDTYQLWTTADGVGSIVVDVR